MDAGESAGAGVEGVTDADADAVGDAVFAADAEMHAEIADGAFVIVTAEVFRACRQLPAVRRAKPLRRAGG